jgi:hypothetical protein
MNMQIFDILGRIIGGIFGIGLLIAYYVWKLQRAGEAADGIERERMAARQTFEQLKSDSRFVHLQQHLNMKYRTSFGSPADPVTYRILYIGLMDARYGRLFVQDWASARYVVAYLERSAGPSRIQAMLDLQTGAYRDMEMPWVGWSGMIPYMG